MIHAGIDIRAVQTQLVLTSERSVLGGIAVPTTEDSTTGAVAALRKLLTKTGIAPSEIGAVMIGTAAFEEAVALRGGLSQVAAVRLCLPASAALPPMADWPADLSASVGGHWYLTHGGHEMDGRRISALSEPELTRIAADIRARQIGAVAISAIFPPHDGGDAAAATAILSRELPGVRFAQAGNAGTQGLLAREGTAILNLGLRDLAQRLLGQFALTLADAGIIGPLFLARGDGTLMDAASAVRQPVQTFGSGAANAIGGAGWLYRQTDAVVIELDQWRLTAGVLHNGLPRQGYGPARISGLRLSAPHPDLLALPLIEPPDTQMLTDIAARLGAENLPVILVGKDAGRVAAPAHPARRGAKPGFCALARAIGAAVAPVSGRVDRCYPLSQFSFEAAHADARKRASQAAMAAGARPDSVAIHGLTEQALPGSVLRLQVLALGQPDVG
ncbi:MAG: hydantoinase/oxoprolinase N-terminal domain-containing protein [Paracoccus sp. (in: a-proteobacteria)]|nr:hydantoinase/oxoprolinase N-terminal domain-containing protein [Paracoccus sp. (in: a-proteobacteria)]